VLSAIKTGFCGPKIFVISFLNRANPFHRVSLFFNFVRNKIYVLKIEVLGPAVLASCIATRSRVIIDCSTKVLTLA